MRNEKSKHDDACIQMAMKMFLHIIRFWYLACKRRKKNETHEQNTNKIAKFAPKAFHIEIAAQNVAQREWLKFSAWKIQFNSNQYRQRQLEGEGEMLVLANY